MSAIVRHISAFLAVGLAATCGRPVNTETAQRQDADRIFHEGLDHILHQRLAPALRSMEEVLRRDPGYVPALSFLWTDLGHSSRVGVFLDSLAATSPDSGMARCMRRAAAMNRGIVLALPAVNGVESASARLCAFYIGAFHERPHQRPMASDSLNILTKTFPEWPWYANDDARARVLRASRTALRDEVQRIVRVRRHPVTRAYVLSGVAAALHERGDDSAALDIEQLLRRDPAWRLPGYRQAWATLQSNHTNLRVVRSHRDTLSLFLHIDSIAAQADTIFFAAIDSGDQRARVANRVTLGVRELDRGRLDQAIRLLTSAVPMIDSIQDPSLRAYVRMRLGRAMVKAGRAPEAERVLLEARDLGDSAAMPRIQKEIHHNLLHLYESLGRDAEALAAGEAFVRTASMGMIDAVRMMSARDVALFLRARGRVDESRRYFARMLADLDTLGNNWNYAGEYYEMTGALDRAAIEYEQGAISQDDPLRAVGGLVRVSLAMGDTAAAHQWATVHDRRLDVLGRPEGAPLLPIVLRRTVGGDATRQAFRKARAEVLEHGQVAAWASLTTDLAEFESENSHFTLAASLADSAREAAQRVGAAETAFRAMSLAAFARVRQRGPDAQPALAALTALATAADRSGSVLLRAEVRRLLGNAHAARGNWRVGLEDFRRAVIPLDSVAGQIAMDPGQAAFRSAQRRAYDDALDAIVRHASSPGAATAFAGWSARRKGRSYAVQLPVEPTAGIPAPPRGTAIVDYVFLDSLVAALVVTADGARIARLSASPPQIRADVKALRSQVDVRVGSKLDVGRARYPLSVAHRLYRSLIEPIESQLASMRHVVIVPDGILALIPFDALVTSLPRHGDPARTTYLLDRFVVTNATTLWTDETRGSGPTMRITLIDPGNAPGADREVGAMTRAFPAGAMRLLRGPAATRINAVEAMRNADIVHFAAHARANEHDPGSSAIELAPNEGDDGSLGATEVASLRLKSPLVILSACETANGVVLDGEGVLSLSRSFLRAGARATVATLWPVGPGAADFAEAFYAGISQSMDASSALRAAKMALRDRGLPPAVWAPYQLFAAPAAPVTRQRIVASEK